MPKIRSEIEFRPIVMSVARRLVLDHHYSARMPACLKLGFGAIDRGPPRQTMACALYSWATGRWPPNMAWELTRLVRLPEYDQPLTKLISKSVAYIRRNNLIDLLVSFADLEEDHHGGIYQAASWIYSGMRGQRVDGYNIDGNFVPARTCFSKYGTTSLSGIRTKLPKAEVEEHYDQGKHLYWKPLSKQGMAKGVGMGLESVPYPKPMLRNRAVENATNPHALKKGVVRLDVAVPALLPVNPIDVGETMDID